MLAGVRVQILCKVAISVAFFCHTPMSQFITGTIRLKTCNTFCILFPDTRPGPNQQRFSSAAKTRSRTCRQLIWWVRSEQVDFSIAKFAEHAICWNHPSSPFVSSNNMSSNICRTFSVFSFAWL